jgi:hypothetical protein
MCMELHARAVLPGASCRAVWLAVVTTPVPRRVPRSCVSGCECANASLDAHNKVNVSQVRR